MKEKSFITVVDKTTIAALIDEGYPIVSISGSIYTFVNVPSKRFSKKIDKTKIIYTDKLCI